MPVPPCEDAEEELMAAWDDVTGEELDPEEVTKARAEEVQQEEVDFISPLQDQIEIVEMNSVVRKTELNEFTTDQINSLAKSYASMSGKTISLANANKLRKMFDRVPDSSLNALRKKKIPFLSGLALSRMIQKKIPVTEGLNEKKADFLRLTFANNQTVKKVERWLYNNLGRANPGYMSMIADDDFIDFEDMNDADGVMTKLKKAGFSFKVDMRWNTTSWGEDLNKVNESFVDKWGHILKIKVGDKVKFVDKGGAHFGKKGKVIRDHGDGSYSVEILFPSGRTLTPNNVKNKDIVKEEVLDEASPTIAKVKDIAKNKQAAKIDGTTVDLFTASAISQVYDKVNDVNKKKMDGMKIIPLANIAMKLLKNDAIKEKNND